MDKFVFPGKSDGFFIDVGASHPITISNTLFFENKGWSGIALEPQLHLCTLWKKMRRTPCYQIALGEVAEKVTFNCITSGTWEYMLSYVEGVANRHSHTVEKMEIQKIKIQQKKLDDIMQEQNRTDADIVFIDVEGYEMNVLRGIDLNKNYIKCFVIENDAFIFGDKNINEYLNKYGYIHIARLYGDDIFLHKNEVQ